MNRGAQAPLVLIAAGGTGGHLFPAEALATELRARGIEVDLATDRRAAPYVHTFPARNVHLLAADTVRGRNPLLMAVTAARLGYGVAQGWLLLGRIRPAAVIGFGGYPTVPPLLAAWLRRLPRMIHEQNAVMGRANRLLARRVTAIMTGYPSILAGAPDLAAKATHVGNPVRPAVREAAARAYDAPTEKDSVRLLVFGGSQGARIMSEIVPAAIERLPAASQARLSVTQQCRSEDLAAVRGIYARLGIKAEVAAFFDDLPRRLAECHLAVARAGASTVAELAVIGRPAILVPLPHALDQDQLANATALAAGGGALMIRQDEFTGERLATELNRLLSEPAALSAMAAAARRMGRPDAAARLADEVVRVAGIRQMRENSPA